MNQALPFRVAMARIMAKVCVMSQVLPFRNRPSQLRLIRPGDTGIALQFPYKVMKRRLDQLLRQHLASITRSRRERDGRLLGDEQ